MPEATAAPDPPDLSPGAVFPDLHLTDHSGNERSLGELVAGDPTVLHFYRGWWCPKEQRFFDVLRGLQAESEVAYTRIVSVSVDPPPVAAAFRAGLGARWTFLADPERVEQRRLALRETTDTLNDPYVPRVYTLTPDRCIHRVYDGYWYWGRPSGAELRADLREISRRVRPEWDAPAA